MEYISAQEAAIKWGITKRRVQVLCATKRIDDAVRIGNMWALPATAEKPTDARSKGCERPTSEGLKNPIRIVRNKIKAITKQIMKQLDKSDGHRAKMAMITLFAAELLIFYKKREKGEAGNDDWEESVRAIEYITGCQVAREISIIPTDYRQQIQNLITEYPFCCDDALSWCYQYSSKYMGKTPLGNTQFFTEKYMIASLVDYAELNKESKILDPACGGANFLLYCFDVLMDKLKSAKKSEEELRENIDQILSMLYGYEIDSDLASVASINLRFKALSLLANYGCPVGVKDFSTFVPCIFSPVEETVSGSLDISRNRQRVLKCGTHEQDMLSNVLKDADAIFTNPPFQTTKGMCPELKSYLKKHYPMAKCDMCNAFIEMTLSIVKPHGIVGLVSQNSWMYLDSFLELREYLLSHYSVLHIWELGSNAFYDLSGEKANVVLLLCKNKCPQRDLQVEVTTLKGMKQSDMEALLSARTVDLAYSRKISQLEVAANGAMFDVMSTDRLRTIMKEMEKYSTVGIPMQGTSTGDAKRLIDYYWNHIGDSDWVPVSKGGGYARWQGLNHYCVKWGKNGEYIKATRGSAIRNASYFDETELVFSDTGTSGLNVRLLMPGQIFVASGPGIRGLYGDKLTHLAFLNSRFASYYIRLLSPKLTVAAGYIAKLPITKDIFKLRMLAQCSMSCLEGKRRRLQKRPNNMEFKYIFHTNDSLEACAREWFLEDIQDEWLQLSNEQNIEDTLTDLMMLTDSDLEAIDECIGEKRVRQRSSQESIDPETMDKIIRDILDVNCVSKRTKAEKKSLGCDGIIELISQKTGISCETIYGSIVGGSFYPDWLAKRYMDLYLHGLVLSAMNYKAGSIASATSDEIAAKAGVRISKDEETLRAWLRTRFDSVHKNALMKAPLFRYNKDRDSVERLGGK